MSYQSHKNATVYFLISISLISFDILRISNPVTIVTTIITIPAIDKYNSMLIFSPPTIIFSFHSCLSFLYFIMPNFLRSKFFLRISFCMLFVSIFSMLNFLRICTDTQKTAGKNFYWLSGLAIFYSFF